MRPLAARLHLGVAFAIAMAVDAGRDSFFFDHGGFRLTEDADRPAANRNFLRAAYG
jgi:hypothetical protein